MTQRELTVYHLAKHSPFLPSEITKLLRLAATHRRLCEMECNGDGRSAVGRHGEGWGEYEEAKRERVEKRITDICDLDPRWDGSDVPLSRRIRENRPKPIFSYDPRGATVKLQVPDGLTDDWGKEGLCL